MLAIHARNTLARALPLLMRLGLRLDNKIQRAAHAVQLPAIRPAVARGRAEPEASVPR